MNDDYETDRENIAAYEECCRAQGSNFLYREWKECST
jgi:hypothetical protein